METPRSFREWLQREEELGEVVRIKVPIKCGDPNAVVDVVPEWLRKKHMEILNCPGAAGKQMETELRALVRYLHTLPKKPIGYIEKPINNKPDVPVIVNLWATRERVLRMYGCKDKEELVKKISRLGKALIKPVEVPKRQAPCKEVIIPEEKVNLYEQVPRCWVEFENVPWSATGGGQWIIYDPETATHDLGEWRAGFFEWVDGDPNKPFPEERRKRYMYVTLIYAGPVETDGGRYYREKFRKLNKPMPAALAYLNDPAILCVAVPRLPLVWPEDGVDEYAAAGGLKGEPIEVVESETIPGLMVPAHAEWVFEGEFLPEDYIIPKFGEAIFSGHMFGQEACPIFRIKCITHRRDPLWGLTWSSNGLDHEGPHTPLANLVFEAEAIIYLRGNGYAVKDVVSYDMETIVIQTEIDGLQKQPWYGKTVLQAFYACPNRYLGNSNKYYICVGPDIDPYDLRDVLWAVNMRAQPVSDSIIIEKGLAAWGDPSALPGPLGWKTYGEQILIDALIKVPERYNYFEPRSEPKEWELKEIQRIKEKLEESRDPHARYEKVTNRAPPRFSATR